MFRPFPFITSSFILGIYLQGRFGFNDLSLLEASSFALGISFFYLYKDKLKKSFIALLLTFLFLGALHLAYTEGNLSPNNIQNLLSSRKIDPSRPVEMIFTPLDTPVPYQNRVRFFAEILEVRQRNQAHPSTGKIAVYCGLPRDLRIADELPFPGDICRAVTLIKPLNRYRNDNSNRFTDYRVRDGVYFFASISSLRALEVINATGWLNIKAVTKKVKSALVNRITSTFTEKEEASVIKAITLGIVDDEMSTLKYQLRMGGIFHIVSVSGIHFGILAVSIFYFFKFTSIRLKWRYVLTICFLILFCTAVGPYPSVLRATIMACLYLTARLFNRKADFFNIISLSALIILFINPRELFSPGFQLTFIITLAIYVALSLFSSSNLKKYNRKIFPALSASAAAFLASVPLTAYYFNQVSPAALINNILLVPVLFVAMNAAFLFFIFSTLQLPFIGIIELILSVSCKTIISLSSLAFQIPLGAFRIPTPNALTLLLYFALLLWLVKRIRNKMHCRFQLFLFIVVLLVLCVHPFAPKKPDALTIHILDVGQGESIFIESHSGERILVDAGGSYDYSEYIGESVISKFLWNKGIKSINCLILTHSHFDHIGGMWVIARNFEVTEFWENGLNPSDDKGYKLLKNNLDADCKTRIIREGFRRKFKDFEMLCLSPPRDSPLPLKTRNEDSLVLILKVDKFAFLITGDINAENENRLVEKYGYNLKSDVLQIPHHGSSKASTIEFIKAVSPETAVLTVGAGNMLRLPSESVVHRYKKEGIRVFRTDYNGRITINADKGKFRIITITGE